MFVQPGDPVLLMCTQLVGVVVHVADLVVEPFGFGHDEFVVDALRFGLPVAPRIGVVAPVAAHPAAVGRVGEAFGFPASGAGGVEVAYGFAFGGVGMAASAGLKIPAVLVQSSETLRHRLEFRSPVGGDRRLDRLSLSCQAGETERFPESRRNGLVALDIVRLVGGRPGVDGPAGPAVNGPVAGQVLDGLVGVVGDDVDGVGLPGPAHGDVGEGAAAAVFEAVGDVDGGREGRPTPMTARN
jgi:hypothetical protein